MWSLKDIGNSQLRKSLRINVEYDHAEKLAWSPDSRAILVYKSLGQAVEVYKLEKKDGWLSNPTKGKTFKQVCLLSVHFDFKKFNTISFSDSFRGYYRIWNIVHREIYDYMFQHHGFDYLGHPWYCVGENGYISHQNLLREDISVWTICCRLRIHSRC